VYSSTAGASETRIASITLDVDAYYDIPQLSTEECNHERDFVVTDLQYIDVENIAISVIRTTMSNIDPTTLLPVHTSEPRIYFLNTVTMKVRDDGVQWNSLQQDQTLLLQEGSGLCPAAKRMPQLGSIITEVAVSSIQLGWAFIRIPLYGVHTVQSWSRSIGCPLVSRGHSALQLESCGAIAMSLKPFF